METVNQEINPITAGEEQPEGRTFTQDEVNTIVSDRLNRERAKYADYDDLKAKAAQSDALQKQLDDLNRANMLARVSAATGVPVDLIQGETEEECTAQAEKIKRFAEPAAAGYPNVRNAPPLHLPAPGNTSILQEAFSPANKHKPKEFNPYF